MNRAAAVSLRRWLRRQLAQPLPARERLEAAASGHSAVMADQIGSRLDSEELEALASLLARLPGAADDGAACLPDAD